MSISRRRSLHAAAAFACVVLLSACATASPGSDASTSATSADQLLSAWSPTPPDGRLLATGTVLDEDGTVTLCLGAIMESYPPQCSGTPLQNWTWEGVDGSESSGDVTWGAYAVYVTYDGEKFTNTDPPIMLALFDPIRPEDPSGGAEGTTTEAELTRIQDEVTSALGTNATAVWTERGYVWVNVLWDDGLLQDAVNAAYGEGVVFVSSVLQKVD